MFVKYNNSPKGNLVIAKFNGLMEMEKEKKTMLLTGRLGIELDAPFAVIEDAFNTAARKGEPILDLTRDEVKRLREAYRPKPSSSPDTGP